MFSITRWPACLRMALLLAGAVLGAGVRAQAASAAPGTGDARIRLMVTAPDEVYRLHGYVGYQIDLEFEAGETFVGLGSGDLDRPDLRRPGQSPVREATTAAVSRPISPCSPAAVLTTSIT